MQCGKILRASKVQIDFPESAIVFRKWIKIFSSDPIFSVTTEIFESLVRVF